MEITTNGPKKKRVKLKLEQPKKQYAVDQCALYGIRGLGALVSILNWRGSPADLERFADRPNSYRVWREDGREIQAPIDDLRTIHARIAILLRRVQPPDFRHSGVRKRSFLTNARQHLVDEPSIKIDVRKFYPSTSFDHVRRCFAHDLRCAGDVAIVLAKLCCYRKDQGHVGHLPTGGVHSEVLGFYCHKKVFDALLARTKARGGTISVYVDDIMATMPNASLTDLEWVRRLFSRAGIEMHRGKSKVVPKGALKLITGVVIQNGNTHATTAQHRKTKELTVALTVTTNSGTKAEIAQSLLGHLDHIAQIDERFKARAVGSRGRLASLVK
jgi:hypothetical protein